MEEKARYSLTNCGDVEVLIDYGIKAMFESQWKLCLISKNASRENVYVLLVADKPIPIILNETMGKRILEDLDFGHEIAQNYSNTNECNFCDLLLDYTGTFRRKYKLYKVCQYDQEQLFEYVMMIENDNNPVILDNDIAGKVLENPDFGSEIAFNTFLDRYR